MVQDILKSNSLNNKIYYTFLFTKVIPDDSVNRNVTLPQPDKDGVYKQSKEKLEIFGFCFWFIK